MRTSTWDGPHCGKRGAKQFRSSPIPSIPCAPSWVSNTSSDIWFCNTVGLCIDTSKPKWIFWTSHHWELPIDMLSKSRRNLGTRTNGSSSLHIHNNQSMVKMALTNRLQKTSPSHRKRRVRGRQRRTPENGTISTKSHSTTPMNVTQKNHWWLRSKTKSQTLIQNLILKILVKDRSLTQTPLLFSRLQQFN